MNLAYSDVVFSRCTKMWDLDCTNDIVFYGCEEAAVVVVVCAGRCVYPIVYRPHLFVRNHCKSK